MDVLRAKVRNNAFQQTGWFPIRKTEEAEGSSLFREFPSGIEVFHWPWDAIHLPAGAVHVARSAGCEYQAFVYEDRVVGLQFHLEVTEEMVRKMLEEGSEEIATGPFVQSPDQILSNVEGFRRINETMYWFLDRLQRLTR